MSFWKRGSRLAHVGQLAGSRRPGNESSPSTDSSLAPLQSSRAPPEKNFSSSVISTTWVRSGWPGRGPSLRRRAPSYAVALSGWVMYLVISSRVAALDG